MKIYFFIHEFFEQIAMIYSIVKLRTTGRLSAGKGRRRGWEHYWFDDGRSEGNSSQIKSFPGETFENIASTSRHYGR